MVNSRIPGPIGLTPIPIIDGGRLARTHSHVPGPIGTQSTPTQAIEKVKLELLFDISQLVLDIVGVVDPTPVSDGASALIAMSRGRWWDAAISAISIVPYVGDLAKLSKLPGYSISIEKAINLARMDVIWTRKLRPVLENLKLFLDKVLEIGDSTLPKSAVTLLNGIKKAIDNFLMRNNRGGGGLGTSSKRSRGEAGKLNRSATEKRDLESSSQSDLKTSRNMSTMEVEDVPNTKFKFKNLQQMDRQFVREETGAVWGTKVKYLNIDERLQYQVQIKDGKLLDAQGNLFDTSNAHSAFGGSGNAIFVMDESGNIYASTVHSVGKFHHSSFLSGQPVASAGEIVVEQGIVKEVTRRSGHYQPIAEQLNQFLDRLNKSGIDLSNVNVGAGF